MKLFRMTLPVLALAALAACEDGSSGTGVVSGNRAAVRFVNAITDGSTVSLVGNGQTLGSALAPGAVSNSCAVVDAGIATLALNTGATNTTTVGSSAAVVRPLLATGATYTVVASGTTADPSILVVNNNATRTITPTAGNATVRFVNATSTPTVDVFATSPQAIQLGVPTTASLALNSAGSFVSLPGTTQRLTFTTAGTATQLLTTDVNFSPGSNVSVVLLPTVTSTGLQAVVADGSCS